MNMVDNLVDYKPVTLYQAKLLKMLGFIRPTKFYWQDTDGIPYVEKGLKIADNEINHNDAKYADVQVYSAPSKKDEDVLRLLSRHLRDNTCAGIMVCKKALLNNDLDIEKALIEIKNFNSHCLVTYKMDDA